MPDPRSAMKEFRFLEQKRAAGGLTLDEELRLVELRDLIGPEPVRTARPGFDVNAAAERLRDALGPRGSGSRPSALALPFQDEDADALLDAALPGGPEPTAAYPVGRGWDPAAEPEPGGALDAGAYAGAEPTWDPNAFADPGAPAEPGAPYAGAEPTWDPNAFADPGAPAESGAGYAGAEPTWDPNAFADPGAPAEPGAPYAGAEPTWDPNAYADPGALAGPGPAGEGDPAWAPAAQAATDPARERLVLAEPTAEPGGLDAEPLLLEDDVEIGASHPLSTWPDPVPSPREGHRPLLAELSLEDDPAAEPSVPPPPGDAAGLPPEGFEAPSTPLPAAPESLSLGEYDEARPPVGAEAAFDLGVPGLAAEPGPEPLAPPPATGLTLGEYDELAPATLARDVAFAPDASAPDEPPATEPVSGTPTLGEYDDTSGFDVPAGAFAEGVPGAPGEPGPELADAGESPAFARTGPLLDLPGVTAERDDPGATVPPDAEALHDPETDGALRLGFQLESGGSFEAMADATVPEWARAARGDGSPAWPGTPALEGAGAPEAGPEGWATAGADPLAPLAGSPDLPPEPEQMPAPAEAQPAAAGGAEVEPIGATSVPTARAAADAAIALPGQPEPIAAWDEPATRHEDAWTAGAAALPPDSEPVAQAEAAPRDVLADGGHDPELADRTASPPTDAWAGGVANELPEPSPADVPVTGASPGTIPAWAAPAEAAAAEEVDEILDIEEAGAVLEPDAFPEQGALPVPLDLAGPSPDDLPAPVGSAVPAPAAFPEPELVLDGAPAPAPSDAAFAPEALPPIDLASLSVNGPEDVSLDDLPTIEGDLLEELPSEELVPLPEPLVDAPEDGRRPGSGLAAAESPGAPGLAPTPAPAAPLARATQVPGRHRVVVHTAEGLTLRGLLEDPDLAAETLRLVPADGGAPEDLAAADLKAVFFMIPPGEPPPPPEGQRVHVTFRDGRRVAGFSPDYADGAPGFFLHPAEARTNTGRIWVYQAAVKQVAVG